MEGGKDGWTDIERGDLPPLARSEPQEPSCIVCDDGAHKVAAAAVMRYRRINDRTGRKGRGKKDALDESGGLKYLLVLPLALVLIWGRRVRPALALVDLEEAFCDILCVCERNFRYVICDEVKFIVSKERLTLWFLEKMTRRALAAGGRNPRRSSEKVSG
jgi:hypothetical protein